MTRKQSIKIGGDEPVLCHDWILKNNSNEAQVFWNWELKYDLKEFISSSEGNMWHTIFKLWDMFEQLSGSNLKFLTLEIHQSK